MSAEQLDLDAIRARANAATPGPWEPDEVHMLTAPTQLDGFAFPDERAAAEAHLWANYLHIAGMDPETTLALVAEVERLRGAASDIERLSDTYTGEGTEIVMQRIIDLRRERDEARAVLGAVAALADRLRRRDMKMTDYYADELDIILAPVSGAVETRCVWCGGKGFVSIDRGMGPGPSEPCEACSGIAAVVAKHEQEVRAAALRDPADFGGVAMPVADEIERRLDEVWRAFGCASNPDAFKPAVRERMWQQVCEMARQAEARDGRVDRENRELRAVLAARADALTEGQS